MTGTILLIPVLVPIAGGILTLLPLRKALRDAILVGATAVALLAAALLFPGGVTFTAPLGGFGLEFSLCLNRLGAFMLAAATFFGLITAIYTAAFLAEKPCAGRFTSWLLISLGLANGVFIADNLLLLLFFWEGLLLPLFGLITLGGERSFRTAVKAFIIVGITDLCLMVGTAMVWSLAGTLSLSAIRLPLSNAAAVAFILLFMGALGKGGSMPFHSWIPDAAKDAPLPFMAIFPGSLEKLLGIYLLTRITVDLFALDPSHWLSMLMMIVGAVTILLAVMMALVQKEYKRLLSYHAISQVGYMILGIGTCTAAGIVGGLFHMVNNALYKNCLFLTGGAVEKQTGTTRLPDLGGLRKAMPVTFACFIVAALSISGVPPFNGFFSKELVYEGALHRGVVFYLAAVVGSFFTAASFLKLGHAAFLGPVEKRHASVREAPAAMLVPMGVLAAVCVVFGVWNPLPLNTFILPALPRELLHGHRFAGLPGNNFLIAGTIVVLLAAWANHRYGCRKTGRGDKALDHIHHAPVLHGLYDRAEHRVFDPYDIGRGVIRIIANAGWWIDRRIDDLYNRVAVETSFFIAKGIRGVHTGSHRAYILWSLAGAMVIIILLLII